MCCPVGAALCGEWTDLPLRGCHIFGEAFAAGADRMSGVYQGYDLFGQSCCRELRVRIGFIRILIDIF